MNETIPGPPRGVERWWRVAWLALTALFVLTAVLNMVHARGGFLTSHLADVVAPAWLYIAVRGLAGGGHTRTLSRVLGRSPGTAAAAVLGGSVLTELSQKRWPHGIFAGTFDPLDLVAFAGGVGACLIADLLTRRGPATSPAAAPRPTSGGTAQ